MSHIKSLLRLLIVVLPCLTSIAGSLLLSACGADQHVKKGDQFYAIGEYYDAAAEYKKAYARTQTKDKQKRGQRAWKMAQSYRRINYTAKAIGGYQNAIRYGYPDSMVLLYLGQLQQKNGDYKNAIKSYTAFLDIVPGDTLALNGIEGCTLAPKWKEQFSLYSIKKEPILTSRRSDFSPALLGDDSDMLYFTSTRNDAKGNEISGITGTKSADIFFCRKDDKFGDSSRQLYEAYRAQDLAAIEKIVFDPETGMDEAEMDRMSYVRNRNWMDKITQTIPVQRVLVAVGAAHLVGEQGLIQLLRSRGYTVEPVQEKGQ